MMMLPLKVPKVLHLITQFRVAQMHNLVSLIKHIHIPSMIMMQRLYHHHRVPVAALVTLILSQVVDLVVFIVQKTGIRYNTW